MKTTTLTTIALGLAFIGAVLLPKDCKAQVIKSQDGRTTYEAVQGSLRVHGRDSGSLLWSITEKGRNTMRMRFRVTGCAEGVGTVVPVTTTGDELVRPEEWVAGGPAIIDAVGQRTCAHSLTSGMLL